MTSRVTAVTVTEVGGNIDPNLCNLVFIRSDGCRYVDMHLGCVRCTSGGAEIDGTCRTRDVAEQCADNGGRQGGYDVGKYDDCGILLHC